MGSRTPDGDGLGRLARLIEGIERRLRTLEQPTGTSVRSLVEQVRQALANITTTVQTAIATLSYTKAEIDTRVANPPAGSNVTGNIAASGTITAQGAVTGASGTFNGFLRSLNARSFVVAANYAASWIDETGRFGISPSSIRYKRDVEQWSTDISRLLLLRTVMFRYDPAMFDDEQGITMTTPKQVGLIAEELEALGFPEFVFRDDEGYVEGINYDRVTVALLRLAQWEHDRTEARFKAQEATAAADRARIDKLERTILSIRL